MRGGVLGPRVTRARVAARRRSHRLPLSPLPSGVAAGSPPLRALPTRRPSWMPARVGPRWLWVRSTLLCVRNLRSPRKRRPGMRQPREGGRRRRLLLLSSWSAPWPSRHTWTSAWRTCKPWRRSTVIWRRSGVPKACRAAGCGGALLLTWLCSAPEPTAVAEEPTADPTYCAVCEKRFQDAAALHKHCTVSASHRQKLLERPRK